MENTIRIAVRAVLYKEDGTFLAVRRLATATQRPLHWEHPGGKLEFGENPFEAIIREVKEETGLVIQDPQILTAVSGITEVSGNHAWISIAYKIKVPEQIVTISTNEHNEYRWVTPNEFQQLETSVANKKIAQAFVESMK